MAKTSNTSARQRRHDKVKAQVVSEIERMEAESKSKYNQAVSESLKNQSTDEKPVDIAVPENLDEKENVNVEVSKMAKNFDFNNDPNNFGENATDETKKVQDMPEIPTIEDDAEEVEEKMSNNAGGKNDKATTEKYDDLEDLAKKNIGNFANIAAKSASVVKLLKENMLIKQFVTMNDFGRGMVLAKQNIAGKDDAQDKTAHFKIENLKPGRAKSVVVTMPRALQEVIVNTSKKSMKGVMDTLATTFVNGELTPEQKADTVDMVMSYDDLMARVANLCEGQIAEFGAKGGILDVDNLSKTVIKTDARTGDVTIEQKDISANQVAEYIGGAQHVLYTMTQPSSGLMAKVVKGEPLGEKDRNAIKRYKDGKTPLKRTKGAYSALYTSKNYTPVTRFATAKPFAAGLTQEDAQALSRKAVFNFNNHDVNTARVESYDAAMVNGDLLKVFDPSIDAQQRFEMLTVAKGYVRTKPDGTPYTKKVPKLDAAGKRVGYESVTETPHDKKLLDRLPKDFFTGKPIDDIASIEFVTYGESGMTKGGNGKAPKATAPRARKYRVSFTGLEAEVSEAKGIVGTFDMTSDNVSGFVNLVGEEVAKEAFVKALSRTSRAKDNNVASEYEDGILSALLANA